MLASESALRAGAGLVSVATQSPHVAPLLARLPEAMVHAVQDAQELQSLLPRAGVIAIGPGLGQDDWAHELWRQVLASGKPLRDQQISFNGSELLTNTVPVIVKGQVIGAIATLLLMSNLRLPPRRFDIIGFILLATGMATLTLALDGQRGLGISPLLLCLLILAGLLSLLFYLLHAKHNDRALFNLKLFDNRLYNIGLLGSFTGRIGSGMLPFITPIFLQVGMGYTPFHAGLMMVPMVLGNMGMKRIVVQIVNRFGYRNVLVGATISLAVVVLLFPAVALMGWDYLLPLVLFLQGMVNAIRFSSMNTLTLKALPDELASSGNSLLSMIMQLSMSIGVTVTGLLLGTFGHHALAGSPAVHQTFIYTYLCMALVIILPAIVFWRVPLDVSKNVVLSRKRNS